MGCWRSKKDAGLIQVYNQVGEIWRSVLCSGDCPPWLYEGASTLSGHNIYVFASCLKVLFRSGENG